MELNEIRPFLIQTMDQLNFLRRSKQEERIPNTPAQNLYNSLNSN